MNTKSVLLATMLGLSLTFAQAASAKPEHRGGPENMLLNPKMIKKLELSEVQVAEIKKIIEDNQVAKDALGGDRRANREQLKVLVSEDVFDEAKARAILEGRQSENLELKIQQLRAHHKILHVLTNEQRVKLDTIRKARAEKRENHAKSQ